MVLTLPMMLPALPVLYVLGAMVWNMTGAGDGGPMWPVTLAYTLMFASIAAANAWLVSLTLARLSRRAGCRPPRSPASGRSVLRRPGPAPGS